MYEKFRFLLLSDVVGDGESLRHVHVKMNALEQAVMEKLLLGEHPTLVQMRYQFERSAVISREFSGRGFFLNFAVPPDVPNISRANVWFGDVVAGLAGVEHGAGFVLCVQGGRLQMLEGYVFTGEWPKNPAILGLHYEPHPRILSPLDSHSVQGNA